MNKINIKQLILLGLLALVVWIIPLFVFVALRPLMLALWITGLFSLPFMKQRNPDVTEKKGYQLFEKLLYFQIINWAFGFFLLIPELFLVAFMIPVTVGVLGFNKERRLNPKFIKWAKYVGFHLFNFILLLILLANFPNIGDVEAVFSIPLITLINGGNAAIYLMLEPKSVPKRRILILLIIIFMMISTAISMFPQADGARLIEIIFGG